MTGTAATEKIREIRAELKKTGLWRKEMPVWVMCYTEKQTGTNQDFLDWLQFIYLPNCSNAATAQDKTLIAPQALKFIEQDVQKGRLLQLLVELDALV
jgi:uncharacterized protein YqcC (DUF446 family)